MKISVTGGSGFIGKALCTELVRSNHIISVLTRKDTLPVAGINFIKGDLLLEKGDLRELVNNTDVVFHCAGEIEDEALMHRLHVYGTERLLAAVSASISSNAKPVHWIQLSSVGAYGLDGAGLELSRVINEHSLEQPIGEYERTKTASDQLVLAFARQEPMFSFSILRPTAVIGSNMPNQSFHALALMIKRGLFFYIGNKHAIANYVHVDDVVRALIQCSTDIRARGNIFLISNDCDLEQIVDALARAMRVPAPRLVLPERLLRFIVRVVSPFIRLPLTSGRIDALTRQTRYSSHHIAQSLGFRPTSTIPEIIPKLVADSAKRLGLD